MRHTRKRGHSLVQENALVMWCGNTIMAVQYKKSPRIVVTDLAMALRENVYVIEPLDL